MQDTTVAKAANAISGECHLELALEIHEGKSRYQMHSHNRLWFAQVTRAREPPQCEVLGQTDVGGSMS